MSGHCHTHVDGYVSTASVRLKRILYRCRDAAANFAMWELFDCVDKTTLFTIISFFHPLRCVVLGVDWRDASHLSRQVEGVVGLSMAVVVHFSAPDGHPLGYTGRKFIFHMGGVYTLTAFVNVVVSTSL